KKIVIFLVVAVLIAAALPIIGNKLVENSLDDRLTTLSSYGLEVNKAETDSSYLSTKKHFEFLLKDSEKFVAYLNKYSDQQIPPYVNAMFDGVLIGADIEYCNFPLSKDLTVDIYPLTLSKSMMNSIKEDDLKFHDYLEKFLHSKGVLYHINYNIVSEDFDGYIKDIKENYTLKDATVISLELLNATFEGNGELIAPDSLNSNIDKINLEVDSAKTKLTFVLDEFSSSSVFESQSTYITGADLKSLRLIVDAATENLLFDANALKFNFSSNTQGEKAELNARSSLKDLSIKSDKIDIVMKDFIYDIAVNGLDKDSLEELRVVTSKTKVSSASILQKDMQNAVVKLMSHGLELDTVKLSLEDVILDQTQSLKGFDVQSKLKIKEDKDLAQKITLSPLLVANNLDMTINIKLSKKLYAKLNSGVPMSSMASAYAKEDAENVLFDITFINGEFKVNGKALR
ncbi:MAG: hypothetical protein U9Q40_00010, partial [Campylobacterota bacterium]|nr:hypothetical protein [Campylobacterota bacterium]